MVDVCRANTSRAGGRRRSHCSRWQRETSGGETKNPTAQAWSAVCDASISVPTGPRFASLNEVASAQAKTVDNTWLTAIIGQGRAQVLVQLDDLESALITAVESASLFHRGGWQQSAWQSLIQGCTVLVKLARNETLRPQSGAQEMPQPVPRTRLEGAT